MNKSLVRKTQIFSLNTLAALVSGQEGIEVSALLSGSRKRPVAKAAMAATPIFADTYIVSRFDRPCLYLCWCKGNESFLDVQPPNAV